MRGAGDDLSVGERIAFYRRRRGLTQAVVAGLVGRSEDWLSKVERGERPVRRLDVLAEVAKALRVSMGDLLGQPVLVEDERREDDVPAVRDTLMAPHRLSRRLFEGRRPQFVDAAATAAHVESAWDDYQHGRLGRVLAQLPRLIQAAQALETVDEPQGSRSGWAVSARVHHLAATTLSKSARRTWHGSRPSGRCRPRTRPTTRSSSPRRHEQARTPYSLSVDTTKRSNWVRLPWRGCGHEFSPTTRRR